MAALQKGHRPIVRPKKNHSYAATIWRGYLRAAVAFHSSAFLKRIFRMLYDMHFNDVLSIVQKYWSSDAILPPLSREDGGGNVRLACHNDTFTKNDCHSVSVCTIASVA